MTTLIIDGDNMLHRAHWVSQKNILTNSRGEDVGTLLHCLRMVKSYAEKYQTKDIYVAWDRKLLWPSTNFRKDTIQVKQEESVSTNLEYKGTRNTSIQVHTNEAVLITMLTSLGVKCMFPRVMEADDVISWLTQKIQGNKAIISADKDLWQLVNDEIVVYNPVKKQEVTKTNFESIVGIQQQYYLTYKALIGDPSDNIKGVYGYGPKKAKKLAENWKDLTPEQMQIFNTNLKLMDLSKGYSIHDGEVASYEQQFIDLQSITIYLEGFMKLCEQYELPSIIDTIETWAVVFSGILPKGKVITLRKT